MQNYLTININSGLKINYASLSLIAMFRVVKHAGPKKQVGRIETQER